MPEDAQVVFNGKKFPLAADSQLPSGRRGWTRLRRPSQPSDPGVPQTARWLISGPLGNSREDVSQGRGLLSVDYTEGIDTLYDGLALPGPKLFPIDLLAASLVSMYWEDPDEEIIPAYTAEVGAFPVGGAPVGGGTASSVPQTVTHFDEDRGQLFFHGGAFSTQVDPSDFEPVQSVIHDAAVRGAANWRNRGYLGLGSTAPMQRRVAVTTIGSTYEDVEISNDPLYAGPMVVGPDRLWWVDAEDSDNNNLRYSLDAVQTQSNSFQVGDPGIPATGLGTYGRSAIAGSEVGAFGFTDLGIPVRVLESLRGQRSPENSKHLVTMWGWTYITTTQGLKATIPGQVENPAGLPRSFEGKPQGIPTAVWPYKDALFCAIKDNDGDTYIMRGEYGSRTGGTGQPDWYPFLVLTDEDVEMIGSTALRPTDSGIVPTSTLLLGVGANGGYVILGRAERDIDDPEYRFTTGALTWTGTTMMRDSNMHKNIRYFSVLLEDLENPQTFQMQVAIDNRSYVNVGDQVTSSGHKFIRPAVDGVPQSNVNGHIFKPRFILVCTDEENPPKVRGTLDMIYDERPDTITEHNFVVLIGQGKSAKSDLDTLYHLYDAHSASSPFPFQLPGESTVRYGFVTGVSGVQDIKGDGIQTATVTVQEWHAT